MPRTDAYPWEQGDLDAAGGGDDDGGGGGDNGGGGDDGPDPQAWVLRPEWEGGQNDCWYNWQKYDWQAIKIKGEDAEDLDGAGGEANVDGAGGEATVAVGAEDGAGGSGDEEEDDDEEEDGQVQLDADNFPPWATGTKTAHQLNNEQRDGSRGLRHQSRETLLPGQFCARRPNI